MNFAFSLMSILSVFCHQPSQILFSKDPVDSFYILMRIDYPDKFPEELKKNSVFTQQLLADFKQRDKKQNKKFAIFLKRDSTVQYDLVMNFSFTDFEIGELKEEQSIRLSTMKKMQTVFDMDAQQHKRQDIDYSADVTKTKRNIECKTNLTLVITNNVDGPVLYKKSVTASYNWKNEYVTYTGDKEALNEQELQLSRNRNQPTPSDVNLGRELLKNSYSQIMSSLDEFFQFKN